MTSIARPGPKALLTLLLAAACAGDDGATSGTGDTAGEELLVAEFESECEGLFSCECDVGYTDAAICAEILAVEWAGIHGSAAAAGLESDLACYKATRPFATYACQTFDEYYEGLDPAACSYCQHGYGTGALGDACTPYGDGISDCAQGLRCVGDLAPTCIDPCAGAGVGEDCEFARCADGLVCDIWDMACVAPGKDGEPCAGGLLLCEEGLTCVLEGGALCRPPAGLGEPCEFVPCQEGLACELGAGLCAEPAGAGESCAQIECAVGLFCDLDQLCTPPGGDGEPCVGGQCAEGLACDFNVELCGPLPGLGEPCFDACADDLWCDFETGECVALPGEGEPCLFFMCSADLVCFGDPGICAPELAEVCVAP